MIKAGNGSEKLISRLSKTHSNTALRPLYFLLILRDQLPFKFSFRFEFENRSFLDAITEFSHTFNKNMNFLDLKDILQP